MDFRQYARFTAPILLLVALGLFFGYWVWALTVSEEVDDTVVRIDSRSLAPVDEERSAFKWTSTFVVREGRILGARIDGTVYEFAVVNGGTTVTFIYEVPCSSPVTLSFHILYEQNDHQSWWRRSYDYLC